jgi:hypothetical protein
MRTRLAPLLGIALAACSPLRAPATSPEVVIARAVGAPLPPVSAASPDALVWTLDDAGAPTTRWLTADGDAGYRELGTAPAILIASGADLWRWGTKTEAVQTVGCDHLGNQPGEGAALRAFVERVGSGERVEVVAPSDARGDVTDVNELQQSASPVGSVGSYLFVKEAVYAYSCGAHGSTGVSLTTWDLEARTRGELLEPAERAAIDGNEAATARTQLPPFDAALTPEDVAYQGPLVGYGAHGWLHVDHAFTTFACYACSDGEWSSYSTSVRIPAVRLPARARPFQHALPVVEAWLAAHPTKLLRGWSAAPPEIALALAAAGLRPDV